jgi:hypothetical protein
VSLIEDSITHRLRVLRGRWAASEIEWPWGLGLLTGGLEAPMTEGVATAVTKSSLDWNARDGALASIRCGLNCPFVPFHFTNFEPFQGKRRLSPLCATSIKFLLPIGEWLD